MKNKTNLLTLSHILEPQAAQVLQAYHVLDTGPISLSPAETREIWVQLKAQARDNCDPYLVDYGVPYELISTEGKACRHERPHLTHPKVLALAAAAPSATAPAPVPAPVPVSATDPANSSYPPRLVDTTTITLNPDR